MLFVVDFLVIDQGARRSLTAIDFRTDRLQVIRSSFDVPKGALRRIVHGYLAVGSLGKIDTLDSSLMDSTDANVSTLDHRGISNLARI